MESFTKWLTLSICLVGILYALWKITDDDEEDAKSTSSSSSNTEPFIPTHEWQEVKPGQAVPPVFLLECFIMKIGTFNPF